VKSWVAWVGYGEYERSGGQPFAGPVPPNLPPEVTDIYISIGGGSYVKSDGCIYTWRDTFVSIKFSDGSSFVWWDFHTELKCPGETVEEFDEVISTGGIEDPNTGEWSGWVRSYSSDNQNVTRRASLRASANAVVDLNSLAGLQRPFVGPEHDEVDLTFAPGAVLDLRGYDGAQGPLFQTNGPVPILCDTVLLDPGVVLSDLIAPPPMVFAGAVVQELALLRTQAASLDVGPSSVSLLAINLGNASEAARFGWIDVLAWSWGGPVVLPLSPLQVATLDIPVQVPAVPPGTESPLQVEMQAGQYLQYDGMALVRAQDPPPPAQVYCTAKTNSRGCTPQIGSSGRATLSGYDDFVIHATDVLPGKHGLAFYGFGSAQIPFQGGLLCVQSPVKRTPVRTATAQNSGALCDGRYAFHMTQEFMQAKGFSAGTDLYVQWWSRDPQAPFGTGLTDAVSLTIGL
jgi:hypothetical protein